MVGYNGPSDGERFYGEELRAASSEVLRRWGQNTSNGVKGVRKMKGRIYIYVGALYVSGARWYKKEHGGSWHIKLSPIKVEGTLAGYNVWASKKGATQ